MSGGGRVWRQVRTGYSRVDDTDADIDTDGDAEGEAPLLTDAEGEVDEEGCATTQYAKSAIASATRAAEE